MCRVAGGVSDQSSALMRVVLVCGSWQTAVFPSLPPPLYIPSIINGHKNKACPQIQSPRMRSTFGVTYRGALDSCLKTAPPFPRHCSTAFSSSQAFAFIALGIILHCCKLAESATCPDSGSFIFSSLTKFMRKMSRADTHVILQLSHMH